MPSCAPARTPARRNRRSRLGYELVGVVEELGPGCSTLQVGDRIGALTVWGADAERVCIPEVGAVEVPEDLDPGEVLSLLFPYMTAYQVLHRTAMVRSGETVLVHGAAGRGRHRSPRAGSAGRASPLRDRFSARPRQGRGARRGGDRLPQRGLPRAMRKETDGVDVVLDSLGGPISLRSFRALRRGEARRVRPLLHAVGRAQGLAGGNQVVCGDRDLWLGAKLSPRRRVSAYHVQKVPRHCYEARRSSGRRTPGP